MKIEPVSNNLLEQSFYNFKQMLKRKKNKEEEEEDDDK